MKNDFWSKYYGSFVGAKIVSFDGMNNEGYLGDGFPTFTVLFADGTKDTIEISQDPEGNGGGFIFGLSVVK
jgi:hypothetical protein